MNKKIPKGRKLLAKRPAILGLDMSLTSSGTVLLDERGEVIYEGLIEPKRLRGAPRLIWIESRLSEILDGSPRYDLTVVLENYAFARANQAHQIGELGGIVRALLHRRGQPSLIASPGQVKKFATGKGNAKKDAMLLGVYKRWGVEFESDDLADAYTLAQLGRGVLGMCEPETQAMRDVAGVVAGQWLVPPA